MKNRKYRSTCTVPVLSTHPLACSTPRIAKVGDEDNGKYSLLVKNSVGEAHLDSLLDVMGKPKPPKVVKEIEPKEVTVPGKKDLRLQCKISGFPMPTIKWMRDGNEIKVGRGMS